MATFLTTQGTSYHIEDIIRNAKKWLVLVSPYLKISRNFYERLKDADRRNISITVVYGKDDLKPEERAQLQKLENLSLYFCDNLHAKCFLNEECVVITSMNMYEFSEKNNREMGVLLRKTEDSLAYNETMKEMKSVVDSSEKVTARVSVERPSSARTDKKSSEGKLKGYCIRCGKNIPIDVGKPFCVICFKEWALWENPHYLEPFCHTCGEPEVTSMDKPLCYQCFRKYMN